MRIFFLYTTLLLIFLIPSMQVHAVTVAPRITDREIIERLTRLEEGQKALNQRFDNVNQRFDNVNQRFDDVNKRFDDVNKRFDDVNQRFDDVNKRIDDLRAEMKTGQESLRAEMKAGQESLRAEMKTGYDALSRRIDDVVQTMLALFGAMMALIVALFGYIIWDRRTMMRPLAERIEKMERRFDQISPEEEREETVIIGDRHVLNRT